MCTHTFLDHRGLIPNVTRLLFYRYETTCPVLSSTCCTEMSTNKTKTNKTKPCFLLSVLCSYWPRALRVCHLPSVSACPKTTPPLVISVRFQSPTVSVCVSKVGRGLGQLGVWVSRGIFVLCSGCGGAEQQFDRLRLGSGGRGGPWVRYRACTSPAKCHRRDWTSCANPHSEFPGPAGCHTSVVSVQHTVLMNLLCFSTSSSQGAD